MTMRQHHNARLMTFRDFMKRRSINEEVAINTSGASFIRLDGSRPTDERQSIIEQAK
jgi:hypothetical protein